MDSDQARGSSALQKRIPTKTESREASKVFIRKEKIVQDLWIVLGKTEGKKSLPSGSLRSLSAQVWSGKSSHCENEKSVVWAASRLLS